MVGAPNLFDMTEHALDAVLILDRILVGKGFGCERRQASAIKLCGAEAVPGPAGSASVNDFGRSSVRRAVALALLRSVGLGVGGVVSALSALLSDLKFRTGESSA